MVRGNHARGTVLEGCSVRKVENPCSRLILASLLSSVYVRCMTLEGIAILDLNADIASVFC